MDISEPLETVKEEFTLKTPNKNCSRRHFNFLLLSFEENKARQRILQKHQVLFSLKKKKKNNEKILMTVVCCSRDWRVKG